MMTVTLPAILLRIVLLLCCGAGVFHAVFRHQGGFMSGGGILYYTIQSNLWVMLVTAVSLGCSVAGGGRETILVSHALQVIRFAVLTGITLTFLIFWTLLAPKMEKAYLRSANNILVHTLVPLLYIADFFLFSKSAPLPPAEVLWTLAMPLYYLLFSMINAAVNPNLAFEGGGRYPYFFMDKDTYGWFRLKGGPGVFWWMLLFGGLTLGLGYGYRFLQTLLY